MICRHASPLVKGVGKLDSCDCVFDFRAWVIRVFNSQNKVHVFYLDYGNTSIVNVVDSQLVPSMFWNLAPRCRPFKIIGINISLITIGCPPPFTSYLVLFIYGSVSFREW